ncbi:MAG: FixH family protein [Bacteroidetes bacterium]|nr:FixH family protein [Bacteroidota bacterium]
MKLNWGFGIAMVYIIFAGSMIAFVVVASRQNYDLVSENYYDDAVKYQQTIDAENNGTRKESQLDIVYVHDKNAIQLSGGAQMKNVKGKLSFINPIKLPMILKFLFQPVIHLCKQFHCQQWRMVTGV